MIIFIPGVLISLVTFPGVIMHEISHRFMCDLFHVPVYEIGYFNIFSKTAGHVQHGHVEKLKHNLMISLAPLFFNSILCMLLTLPFNSMLIIPVWTKSYFTPLYLILWWIGISMGANAFPSNQDVNNVIMAAEDNTYFSLRLLSYIIRLLNLLSTFWMSFIYALGISFILPIVLFR